MSKLVFLLAFSILATTQSTYADIAQETAQETVNMRDERGALTVDYFNIFYGPSVKKLSPYQSDANGHPDPERPISTKNFLSVGTPLSEDVLLSGTVYWNWRMVKGHKLALGDPYLRLAHESLVNSPVFNLYADLRVHFGISDASRSNDMLTGLQSFHIADFNFGRWMIGTYTYVRKNFFGNEGVGNEVELYVGPHINYRASESFTFSMLVEMSSVQLHGDRLSRFINDTMNLQPGFIWQLSQRLVVNPYLTVNASDHISLATTSLGLTLNWQII